MGNQNQNQAQLIDSTYIYVNRRNDPNYGEIKVYTKKAEKDLVAIITRSISNINEQQTNITFIENRKQLIHPILLGVYGYRISKAEDLCSSVNLMELLVEYIPNTLALDTKSKKNQTIYTENEIWYLIFNIIEALNYLLLNGDSYTDLHPSKILINDKGQIKLMDQRLLNQPIPNFMQVKYAYRNLEYLAPEQLEDLYSIQNSQYDYERVNVYCLALIVAEIMTFMPISSYYTQNDIDSIKLLEDIDKTANKYQYSTQLTDLLQQMLHVDPLNRPTYQFIISLENQLQPDQIASSISKLNKHKNHHHHHHHHQKEQQQQQEQQPVPVEINQSQLSPQIHQSNQQSLQFTPPSQQIQFTSSPPQPHQQSQQPPQLYQTPESNQDSLYDPDLDDRIQQVLQKSEEALKLYGKSKTKNPPQHDKSVMESMMEQSNQFVDIFPVTGNYIDLTTPNRSKAVPIVVKIHYYPQFNFQPLNRSQQAVQPNLKQINDRRIQEIMQKSQEQIQKSIKLSTIHQNLY